MVKEEQPGTTMWLVALFGPEIEPIQLQPAEAGLLIGRHEQCALRLRSDQVSRQHARLIHESGQWRLEDLSSRWGTFINGIRLAPGDRLPLREGDLIRISPWTFSLSRSVAAKGGVESLNDAANTRTLVKAVETQQATMASDLLGLLLESAAGMHAAENERAMAEILIDAAIRGTGLANAAVLRPLDGVGRVEVLASRRAAGGDAAGALFSRALLSLASTGVVAQLSSAAQMLNTSESIVQMNIDAAMCVPLMLGTTVAAYLYLDSRGVRGIAPRVVSPSAGAFCLAMARMAALALANLKRIDIERRQAQVMTDLLAGAEAQRWILPERRKRVGAIEYIGESRPGRHVAGDFFDVIPLSDTRVAVTLGDVCGKGVAASVLMSAAQGYLQGALRAHGQVERAVEELNRYVMPRRPVGKFITMWIGVIDTAERTLRYVDAGHGYALLVGPDGSTIELREGEAVPVGVNEQASYTAEVVRLEDAARLVLISDGIVEQSNSPSRAQDSRLFLVEGVKEALSRAAEGADEVAAIFDAVVRHAGTAELADDATALVVRWS